MCPHPYFRTSALGQEVRTLFLKSTQMPRSQGTGFPRELLRVAGGERSKVVVDDPSSPVLSPVPCYVYGWY